VWLRLGASTEPWVRLVNRRIFLRGLGGACVAAPFLGSVGSRSVRGQSVTPPKRLIVMFTHYGCVTTRFFPAKSHGALTAADLESTTLAPLVPYVDKLLLPRGIRAMNEWTGYLLRGQGNDPHIQVVGSYFTCQPVSPNSDDPFSFDTSTRFPPKPVGPSLDHVMAQQLSPGQVPLFMRVGNRLENTTSTVSYSAAETPFPGIGSAAQIFGGLTGLFPGGGSMTPDSYQAARGKSILDLVSDDLDTLARFDMSQSDRDKLAAWKELLYQTGQAAGSLVCSENGAAGLGLTAENIGLTSSAASGGDVLTTKVTDSLDVADIYSNLAVLAAICNANPVIFLKYPGQYIYTGLGLELDAHGLSHRIGNAGMQGTCVEGVLDMILEIDAFHARKFAHLVGQLNAIDEGDGTLLDNTASVWFQEMSDGCSHNLNNLPIVQAGGAGGYFKTGWAVNVEDASANLTPGNSEFWCAQGALDQFQSLGQESGTDASYANAPINKYYCTLMNALGVKAGADGFPALGGTAEVTHYGMYDKTEDFIGGGTNPPTIHDPGEFSALRANG
jgi:hypothetical protein